MSLTGLRKWSVAVLGIVLAFVLALLDKLTGNYATIIVGVVGSFHASNAFTTGKGGDATK